ncbi:hypothetical protein JCM5353_002449 [Sporobolomyces roseus]
MLLTSLITRVTPLRLSHSLHSAPRLLSSKIPDTSYLSATRADRDAFGFKNKSSSYTFEKNTSLYVCTLKLNDLCETEENGTVYTKGIEVVGKGKSKIAAEGEARQNAGDVMEDLEHKAKVHEQA